jgi:type IV secretion system protein VirB9
MSLILRVLLILSTIYSVNYSCADEVISTDHRIRTLVFNESDVYRLVVHYGYQSSIEFGPAERVTTISLGDTYAWKVTPVGRRLFIKPLQNNMHTNMTVITNMHTYQFDLMSRSTDGKIDNELIYVLRFYYPAQLDS